MDELINAVVAMDDPTPAIPVVSTVKRLVVFVDTQADFMLKSGALYVQGAEELISKLNSFAFNLDPKEVGAVLMTFDTHNAARYSRSEEAKQFPVHCVDGSPGWENVINRAIIPSEIAFWELTKQLFDMWNDDEEVFCYGGKEYETERSEMIEQFEQAGIRDVTIVGVAADFCVKWAADGFLKRGWNVEIPRTLTAGIVRDIDTVAAEDYAGAALRIID